MGMVVTSLSTHLSHQSWRIFMYSEECRLKRIYNQKKVIMRVVNAAEITLYEI